MGRAVMATNEVGQEGTSELSDKDEMGKQSEKTS